MIYYADEALTLHHGHALDVLREMPAGSVNCTVTSPPYFGLRDYGEPGQYGLEKSPAEYVENMRALFAEVRRVLAVDGTLWLNLGDSYSSKTKGSGGTAKVTLAGPATGSYFEPRHVEPDRPDKNLLGIPWRVAFALQDDDSGDIYELNASAPEFIRSAVYLETCRTKTPRLGGNTTGSTQSGGEMRTPSNTQPGAQLGTQPTETSSRNTAGSTTSCTASRRLSDKSEGTLDATEGFDSQPSSTTEASSQPAPAVESGTYRSLPSTTSAAEATSTASNSEPPTYPSSSSCDERDTQPVTESSATTAIQPSGITVRVPTKMRLRKSQIQPDWLTHFRLVKQERWILRNAIVWAKPNAMPESVTDRLSTRHELIFLFTRSRRYWFDLDPIREPCAESRNEVKGDRKYAAMQSGANGINVTGWTPGPRNPGDVWSIPTVPFPGAHFATFPPEIPRRCILAGCKPGGTVLDPFSGSGTTGMVAAQLGRRYVGIDLSRDYLDLSLRTRLGQTAMLDGESA